MKYLIGSFLLFPAMAMAQDLPWSPAETETCLAQADGAVARQVCIGLSAAACINTPDGYTTVGTGFCLGKEADYWDGRLNAAYAGLIAAEQQIDDEMEELGSAAPKMEPALREMQRAWIVFRDKTCEYEVTQWGGGTGGGPAYGNCVMRLTAEQALTLEDRLSEKEMQ